MRTRALVLVGCLLLAGLVQAQTPINLVKNGDFTEQKDNLPAGWKILLPGQQVAMDKSDPPKDLTGSLRVAIKTAAESQGAITQTLKNPPQKTKLALKAQLKGSAARLGYVQVKLKRAGKELRREKTPWNTLEWEAVSIEFATEEADEITLECRVSQSEKAKDQTVWFAGLSLTEVK